MAEDSGVFSVYVDGVCMGTNKSQEWAYIRARQAAKRKAVPVVVVKERGNKWFRMRGCH